MVGSGTLPFSYWLVVSPLFPLGVVMFLPLPHYPLLGSVVSPDWIIISPPLMRVPLHLAGGPHYPLLGSIVSPDWIILSLPLYEGLFIWQVAPTTPLG